MMPHDERIERGLQFPVGPTDRQRTRCVIEPEDRREVLPESRRRRAPQSQAVP